VSAADGSLAGRLAGIVGDEHVLVDPGVAAGYLTDWTGRFAGASPAVVRPGTVEEVAAVLAACNEAGAAVVPQGGNTGLVGGSVPLGGEVVLSLRRLSDIEPVDRAAWQVTVGAGATLASVQAAGASAGLAFGVDLGARDSATIGGMVATNAGGLHLLRYGGMRDQVVGYEAVLADGRVLAHLDGLLKDNTGYDLGRLLCGSEGTLAVVTRLRLRLVPHYRQRVSALLAFGSIDAALGAVTTLREELASVEAIELFFGEGMELVSGALGVPSPFAERHAVFVLVECSAQHDPTDELAAVAAGLDDVADVAVAQAPGPRAALWRLREGHPEAINQLGPPHKLDVTLPASRLAEFVETVPGVVRSVAPGGRTWLFGHAADGNIHVNVTGVDPEDEAVDEAVLRHAAALGGSISAEHGIGTAKRAWLHLNRSPEELAVFRAIKAALDPKGILNPNVLLPSEAAAPS
jgi:FAD/FMN-containing dehydrogenase